MKLNKNFFSFLLLLFLIIFSYRQFFFQKKIPLPSDLLVGAYYPWLDYKWGTITGVPIKNPVISDVFSQFYPWKNLIIDIFKQKELPLWNQYSYSGTPILENYHSGVFFPGNILLFLPKNIGWSFFIFFQTLIAATGVFFFLKKYSNNTSSRIISSLIYGFSGLMTTWTEFGTGTWAAALIPWALFFLDRYLINKKVLNLVFFTFSLTSLYLAGNAQLTFFSTVIISLYLLANTILVKKRKYASFFIIGIYLVISIALASIELFPAYKQQALSVRSSEAYSKTFNYGLTPFYELIRLYNPDFYGNPTTYNYWGKTSYHENACFLGVITLPIILPLFFRKKRKKYSFWLLTFIFSIFLALDHIVNKFIYSQSIPLLTYSSASRIFFITSLSASVLFTHGFDYFLKNLKYRKKVLLFTLLLVFVNLAALVFLKITNIPITNLIVSIRNSAIPLIGLFLLFVIILFKIPIRITVVLLIFFSFFDLSRYFLKYNTFVDSALIFPNTPAIDYLQNDKDIFRIGRLNREIMTPNTWTEYRLSSVEGYDPLALENYSRFFNRVNQNSYQDHINRYSELFNPDINFLSSLNVKYLLSVENEKIPPSPYVKMYNLDRVYVDKSTVIYKNKNYLPRAYFIQNLLTVANKKELTTIIDDEKFNPLKTTLVLTSEKLKETWTKGELSLNYIKNNSIELQLSSEEESFVVIANTYHPGWHAYVDDKEVTVYEINGALCGIKVPGGNHILLLKYWPKSVDVAIKIFYFASFFLTIISITIYYLKFKKKLS